MARFDEQDLLQRLSAQALVLPLRGEDVEVLDSPDAFFQELLAGLRTAQRHISIASLYFGTGGGREAEFADALAAAAYDPARPHLRMRLLLDALRSTRPTPGTAAPGPPPPDQAAAVSSNDGDSSSSSSAPALTSTAEMLAVRLLEGQAGSCEPPDPRVAVALFHTPALRGLLKRVLPPRVSEVIGVCHCKAYVFDDTVIISGANISSTYLSTRQDRYLVLRAAPQLAALLRAVVAAVSRFSYELLPLPPPGAGETPKGAQRRRRDVLLDLLKQQQLPWQQARAPGGEGADRRLRRPPHHLQRGEQQRRQRYRLAPCPAGVDPVRQAYRFAHCLRQELLPLLAPRSGWDAVLDLSVLAAQEEAAQEEAAAAPAHHGDRRSEQPPPRGWGQEQLPGSDHPQAGLGGSGGGWPAWADAQAGAAATAGRLGGGADTWIVPMVQAGFAGLRQEERCTLSLLSWATQQQQQGAQDAGRWSWDGGGGGSGSTELGGPAVLLQLASPYLNLARPYESFLARQAAAAELELITASPEANGFFGSSGVSGYIPLAYSLLEHRTWRRLTRHQGGGAAAGLGGLRGGGAAARSAWRRQQLAWRQRWAWRAAGGAGGEAAGGDGVPAGGTAAGPAGEAPGGQASVPPGRRLYEYCRPGWEFHAKGLWVSPPAWAHPPPSQAGGASHAPPAAAPAWAPPLATAVGSSNFGFRSLHRDLELQFLLVTTAPGLRRALAAEAAALKQHCQRVAGDAHFQAPGRRGGAVARLAVRMLRGFL